MLRTTVGTGMRSCETTPRRPGPGLRLLGTVLAAVVAASAACLSLAGASVRDDRGGSTTPWSQQSIGLPSVADSFSAISCGSTNDCVAASDSTAFDSVLRSTTGGTSWTGASDTIAGQPGEQVNGIDCLSAEHCLGVASDPGIASLHWEVVETQDGGATWSAIASPPVPGGDYLTGMMCPTAGVCLTVRDDGPTQLAILRSTDGGKTWAPSSISGGGSGAIAFLVGVSCPTSSTCVAVGASTRHDKAVVVRTTDSGGSWRTVAVPSSAKELVQVSCDQAGHCVAVSGDSEALLSSDTGRSWVTATLPAGLSGDDAYCSSGSHCLVTGSVGVNRGAAARTDNGGTSWKVTRLGDNSGSIDALSCPTPTYCVATRQDDSTSLPAPLASTGFAVTTNGGATFAEVAPPDGVVSLNGVACATPGSCFAVGGVQGRTRGGVVLHSADHGVSWQLEDTVATVGNLAAIDCPSASTCVAVGEDDNWGPGTPTIVSTTDGGAKWTSTAVGNSISLFRHLACPSAFACVAAGETSSGAGRLLSWTVGGNPKVVWKAPAKEYIQGLACHGSSLCLAVGAGKSGAAVVRSTDGGAHWSELASPKGISIMRQLSCPSAATCFAPVFGAGSGVVAVTHDSGERWSVEHSAPTGGARIHRRRLYRLQERDALHARRPGPRDSRWGGDRGHHGRVPLDHSIHPERRVVPTRRRCDSRFLPRRGS